MQIPRQSKRLILFFHVILPRKTAGPEQVGSTALAGPQGARVLIARTPSCVSSSKLLVSLVSGSRFREEESD